MDLGSELLTETEQEARERGAYFSLVYAFDWQAGFFTKNGYTIVGELPDFPKGHSMFTMEKRF